MEALIIIGVVAVAAAVAYFWLRKPKKGDKIDCN